MRKVIRRLIERKLGRKFITKKEKDALRKKVLSHDFIDGFSARQEKRNKENKAKAKAQSWTKENDDFYYDI